MRKLYYLFATTLMVFISCKVDNVDNPVIVSVENTPFELIGKDGQFQSFLENETTIHFVVPNQYDLSCIRFQIKSVDSIIVDSTQFAYHGESFDLNDFTRPIKVRFSGMWKTVVIHDIPVLLMNTPDGAPIISKTVRKEGCSMTLINSDGSVSDLGTAGIRGRGNSTWEVDKKPYNIKLDKKHEILGMQKSKHWILLACAVWFDRTRLHNATAFEMARMTDYPWVQSGEFVELILNGEHRGLYYLCEKIRVEKGKIDIDELSPTDISDDVIGGGLFVGNSMGARG